MHGLGVTILRGGNKSLQWHHVMYQSMLTLLWIAWWMVNVLSWQQGHISYICWLLATVLDNSNSDRGGCEFETYRRTKTSNMEDILREP